mmetsp:Transcript_25770/g.68850  ORF Transcript_25770/g.68850 Transcript_25770/m.68850 type:complete len:256 (+) Transcript_25770:101-868(+)
MMRHAGHHQHHPLCRWAMDLHAHPRTHRAPTPPEPPETRFENTSPIAPAACTLTRTPSSPNKTWLSVEPGQRSVGRPALLPACLLFYCSFFDFDTAWFCLFFFFLADAFLEPFKLNSGTCITGVGDLDDIGDLCIMPAVNDGEVNATRGWDDGRRPDVGLATARLFGDFFCGVPSPLSSSCGGSGFPSASMLQVGTKLSPRKAVNSEYEMPPWRSVSICTHSRSFCSCFIVALLYILSTKRLNPSGSISRDLGQV